MDTVSERAFRDVVDSITKARNGDYSTAMSVVADRWIKEYESGLPRLTKQQYEILKSLI